MNSNEVWGGGEKWHLDMATYLHDRGYFVMVVTNKNSELYKRVKDRAGILLVPIRVSNFSFINPLKIICLRNLFRKHLITSVLLGLSNDVKVGGLAAKLAGVEKIIYRRGTALPVKNTLLNRYLFRKVLSHIITNSKDVMNKVFMNNKNITDPKKVSIIYNGVDLQKWSGQKKQNIEKDKEGVLTLGNAGRLVEQKCQKYLIEIATKLKGQNIPFKLYIAGSGPLEKNLKQACKQHSLEKEIVFLDFVDDVGQLFNSIEIYLTTSMHEGSSHVVLEAMASGIPVIAFDISSMPEIVVNEHTGYLVPFADTDSYTDRIKHLKYNPELLEEMGRNAQKEVAAKFEFSKNMNRVLELIEA